MAYPHWTTPKVVDQFSVAMLDHTQGDRLVWAIKVNNRGGTPVWNIILDHAWGGRPVWDIHADHTVHEVVDRCWISMLDHTWGDKQRDIPILKQTRYGRAVWDIHTVPHMTWVVDQYGIPILDQRPYLTYWTRVEYPNQTIQDVVDQVRDIHTKGIRIDRAALTPLPPPV
jgi:hypothetical protein